MEKLKVTISKGEQSIDLEGGEYYTVSCKHGKVVWKSNCTFTDANIINQEDGKAWVILAFNNYYKYGDQAYLQEGK
jgi:hypothetical protein